MELVGDDRRQDSNMMVNSIQLMDQTIGKFVDPDVVARIGNRGGRLGNPFDICFDAVTGEDVVGAS